LHEKKGLLLKGEGLRFRGRRLLWEGYLATGRSAAAVMKKKREGVGERDDGPGTKSNHLLLERTVMKTTAGCRTLGHRLGGTPTWYCQRNCGNVISLGQGACLPSCVKSGGTTPKVVFPGTAGASGPGAACGPGERRRVRDGPGRGNPLRSGGRPAPVHVVLEGGGQPIFTPT